MRNSVKPARQANKKCGKGRQIVTPLCGASDHFLTIPRISKAVPAVTNAKEDEDKWLQVAMLCAELVEDNELDISDKTPVRDIISMALHAWVSKQCAEVQVLDGFDICAAIDPDAFYIDYQGPTVDENSFWGFVYSAKQTGQYFNVKDSILALESVKPGLGHTALLYAERASFRTATAFTPSVGFYHASGTYWYGMDNDEDVKEEIVNMGEMLEEGMLLPSTYKSSFPDVFFGGKVLTRNALKRIPAGNTMARETAEVVLSIMDLIEQDAKLPDMSDCSLETAAFSCILGTGDNNDQLTQVLDDYFQNANYCGDGYTDIYGYSTVPFEKTAFLNWRDGMEKGFALYACLDRLVRLIGK